MLSNRNATFAAQHPNTWLFLRNAEHVRLNVKHVVKVRNRLTVPSAFQNLITPSDPIRWIAPLVPIIATLAVSVHRKKNFWWTKTSILWIKIFWDLVVYATWWGVTRGFFMILSLEFPFFAKIQEYQKQESARNQFQLVWRFTVGKRITSEQSTLQTMIKIFLPWYTSLVILQLAAMKILKRSTLINWKSHLTIRSGIKKEFGKSY